jgi:tetratricopeptide (TPR) repeat protein
MSLVRANLTYTWRTIMWLTSRGDNLSLHQGRLIFTGDLDYGMYSLISKLTEDNPRIWLEFTEKDCYDDISQGDKLAEACGTTLGSRLHALPYQYGMSILKSQLPALEPHVFVLTNAHFAPDFAKEFLTLQRAGHRVIVHFGKPIHSILNTLTEDARVVSSSELQLSYEEAYELVAKRLLPHEVEELLDESKGAHDLFVAALCKRLYLAPPLVSGPNGPKFLGEALSALNATQQLELLTTQKRWLEALELTVAYLPERTSEVLAEAGHVFHERGLHKRLWGLLSPLPDSLKEDERVLFWLLSAAFRLGDTTEIAPKVKEFLQHHEAPDLRAFYAGVLAPYDEALNEARRAYEAKPNAFTLYQLGAKTTSIAESVKLLEASVKLATDEGRGYEVVRNACVLTEKLILQGNYQSAASWGEWALSEFDRYELKDNLCRLNAVNAWAYARILCSELAGLEPLLAENIIHLEVAYPSLARLFRSTLGDYLIASDRPHEAVNHYEVNLANAPRYHVAAAIHDLTRGLIEVGRIDEALNVSKNAIHLLENESPVDAGDANLAYGMVLTLHHPNEAEEFLEKAHRHFSEVFIADRLVQTTLYLAFVKHKLGNTNEAKTLLSQCGEPLYNLSTTGLKLLSGPEDQFRDILSFVKGDAVALELRLLGAGEVWLNNEKLDVPPLWIEVLGVMCLKERPLSLEEMLSFLYGDGGNKDNLKANLSKMRRVFPISQHPYRLTLTYTTDIAQIQNLLAYGKVSEALKLYKGSVLPYSDAPFLRHIDEVLAETIRQATLQSQDSEALFSLLEYYEDDLELLETLSGVIKNSDPRSATVGARLKQLHKDYEVEDHHAMYVT